MTKEVRLNSETKFTSRQGRIVGASCSPRRRKGLANYIAPGRKVVELQVFLEGDAHDGSRLFADPSTGESWLIDNVGHLKTYSVNETLELPQDEQHVAWEEALSREIKRGEDVSVKEP